MCSFLFKAGRDSASLLFIIALHPVQFLDFVVEFSRSPLVQSPHSDKHQPLHYDRADQPRIDSAFDGSHRKDSRQSWDGKYKYQRQTVRRASRYRSSSSLWNSTELLVSASAGSERVVPRGRS